MKTSQVSTKFFATDDTQLDPDKLIPVFHRWIREKALEEELLIDVADYRHVPNGPYLMVVAHEAHYAWDGAGGRDGLAFYRKRDPVTDAKDAVRKALRDGLRAALLLEQAAELEGAVRFRNDEFQVRFMNRLTVPNDKSSCERLEGTLRELFRDLGLPEAKFSQNLDRPREALAVTVRPISEMPPLEDWLQSI